MISELCVETIVAFMLAASALSLILRLGETGDSLLWYAFLNGSISVAPITCRQGLCHGLVKPSKVMEPSTHLSHFSFLLLFDGREMIGVSLAAKWSFRCRRLIVILRVLDRLLVHWDGRLCSVRRYHLGHLLVIEHLRVWRRTLAGQVLSNMFATAISVSAINLISSLLQLAVTLIITIGLPEEVVLVGATANLSIIHLAEGHNVSSLRSLPTG